MNHKVLLANADVVFDISLGHFDPGALLRGTRTRMSPRRTKNEEEEQIIGCSPNGQLGGGS